MARISKRSALQSASRPGLRLPAPVGRTALFVAIVWTAIKLGVFVYSRTRNTRLLTAEVTEQLVLLGALVVLLGVALVMGWRRPGWARWLTPIGLALVAWRFLFFPLWTLWRAGVLPIWLDVMHWTGWLEFTVGLGALLIGALTAVFPTND